MSISIIRVLILFLISIIGVLPFVAAVFLQIYLSKKENKWLGFILPSLCLVMSFVLILGISIFPSLKLSSPAMSQDIISLILSSSCLFLIYNIPTVILMLIYKSCSKKIKNTNEIDKMAIQDL